MVTYYRKAGQLKGELTAVAVGAVTARGRRNGRWLSHKNAV
jgi:hypothetical protein